jgi:hypothetical protein
MLGSPAAHGSDNACDRGLKVPVSQCLRDLDTGYSRGCQRLSQRGTSTAETSCRLLSSHKRPGFSLGHWLWRSARSR